MNTSISNKYTVCNDIKIFYREAGDPLNPSLLLLHGYPTSSVMFKGLMNTLSDKYHLIAPDYPGFGFSDFPDTSKFDYSFDNISKHLDKFCKKVGLKKFFIYLHDYGSTIGMRICLMNPSKIIGIIVQNGNSYEEGLGSQWDQTKDYWLNPTQAKKKNVMSFISEKGTREQYTAGVPKKLLPLIGPELWQLDWALLQRPGNVKMQADLNYDYRNNLPLFSKFQEFFRKYQPPALIIWGKYDVFFNVKEAHCYLRDLPKAEVQILEGGHMALETNFSEISYLIGNFLKKQCN
ncbi:MAG: alpha/beta hydrolase [Sphingobacteriales bacterium]|nr:MAG: alpha/beta hydrolase [Sphingobacteriales bacterium]